jgi:hypothetical protein
MQSTCPVCQASFTNIARPKTYCSVDCQSKAANDCGSTGFVDLHRCVAGRMNKAASTRREDAVANDRPPLGYAVKIAGEWIGRRRDRRSGVVIWQSLRFGSVEEAKAAVEASLRPVEVEAAANMNLPQPLAMAA